MSYYIGNKVVGKKQNPTAENKYCSVHSFYYTKNIYFSFKYKFCHLSILLFKTGLHIFKMAEERLLQLKEN